MVTGWRIVPAKLASTAFDGEGAKRFGGRWNSVGIAVVYASEHQSLAALETRVDIDSTSKKTIYKCFAFHFDKALMDFLPSSQLPNDWRQEPPSPSVQQLGDAWVASKKSVILAVPSIIIPIEMNLLLNPAHPDFHKIQIDKPTDFAFDRRLFG